MAGEEGLCRLIAAEEEGGAGGGTDNGAADTAIDATEAARGKEAARGLQARLERVEGVEGEVDCRSSQTAGEEGVDEGGRRRGGHGDMVEMVVGYVRYEVDIRVESML